MAGFNQPTRQALVSTLNSMFCNLAFTLAYHDTISQTKITRDLHDLFAHIDRRRLGAKWQTSPQRLVWWAIVEGDQQTGTTHAHCGMRSGPHPDAWIIRSVIRKRIWIYGSRITYDLRAITFDDHTSWANYACKELVTTDRIILPI